MGESFFDGEECPTCERLLEEAFDKLDNDELEVPFETECPDCGATLVIAEGWSTDENDWPEEEDSGDPEEEIEDPDYYGAEEADLSYGSRLSDGFKTIERKPEMRKLDENIRSVVRKLWGKDGPAN